MRYCFFSFKDEGSREAAALITAFEDAWHWNAHTEQVYRELVQTGAPAVVTMIGALREAIGANLRMAYLVMRSSGRWCR